MRSTIRKWGNSASLRIPAALMQEVGLSLDDEVEIRQQGDQLIIERLRESPPRLQELLNAINPDNLHDEVDAGEPVGREAL